MHAYACQDRHMHGCVIDLSHTTHAWLCDRSITYDVCRSITYDVCRSITYDVCRSITYDVCRSITYDVSRSITYDVSRSITYDVVVSGRILSRACLIERGHSYRSGLSPCQPRLEACVHRRQETGGQRGRRVPKLEARVHVLEGACASREDTT
jgi:hypothetical protein